MSHEAVARPRLAVVVSSEMTVQSFLLGHLKAWSLFADVTVIANTRDQDLLVRAGVQARLYSVGIERPIRPIHDMTALFCLWRLFRRERYDAVLSITPKAGLLAMAGAFLARVPKRFHVFTGQVWVTRHGVPRLLLKSLDRAIARLALQVLIDGQPQREFLLQQKVVSAARSRVLGDGSLCGVDLSRFKPDMRARESLRQELAWPTDAVVFLYLGRLNVDKGGGDLVEAFCMVAQEFPGAHLMLVGPDEGGMKSAFEERLAPYGHRVHLAAYTSMPERYMAAADVFCLPSLREGFPTSILEAAACRLPAIASRIYGIQGALVEGKGGLMHEPGNASEIAACMRRMLREPDLRKSLGEGAATRVSDRFGADRVIGAYAEFLRQSLGVNR